MVFNSNLDASDKYNTILFIKAEVYNIRRASKNLITIVSRAIRALIKKIILSSKLKIYFIPKPKENRKVLIRIENA